MPGSGERAVSAVLMRGGTSKGVFVRESDLPAAGPARDQFILALMGTPDPMQLDGLGGTHSSTSKLMAVSASERPDCDVDYLFVQVGVDRPIIDDAGNCGNLTAAVGVYAIQEGLVAAVDPQCQVRLFNKNTSRRIVAHVPVRDGCVPVAGDAVVPGVPGTGAPIVTEYLDPAGAVTGRLLPTGRCRDVVVSRHAGPVEVSIVDVCAPVVFVRSDDLRISGGIAPAEINARRELLAVLESIRGAAAALLGMARDEADALDRSPVLPRLCVVSSPRNHEAGDGPRRSGDEPDLVVRAMSMQRAHHACPLTSALCAAAAARVPGTIPCELADAPPHPTVRVAHPKGIVDVGVQVDAGADAAAESTSGGVGIRSVSVVRTARRLFAGTAFVRAD